MRPPDDARFAAVEFALSLVPVRCRCRPCGAEYGPEVGAEADAHGAEAIHFVPELAHSYLRCPRCQSPDFDILEGRGVTIGRIEGERDE